jgi:hypothetical protein
MIRIFIGYDHNETVAFHVLCNSIHRHASQPVSITPLMLSQLRGTFHRERDPKQSTDFAFSRFMIPSLCEFQGWAIFTDCDFLCFDDIAKLWELRDDRYAVMCVKHNYEVHGDTKFLGQVQTRYEKKNWSSMMLLNCAKCTALTPEYVNAATGLQLHQFKWLESEELIGEVPKEWNYLVNTYPRKDDVHLVHYTDGGPYFHEYANCDYAPEWFAELKLLGHVAQRG